MIDGCNLKAQRSAGNEAERKRREQMSISMSKSTQRIKQHAHKKYVVQST